MDIYIIVENGRVTEVYADMPNTTAIVLDLDAAKQKSPEALESMREKIEDIAAENSYIEYEEKPEP